MKKELPFKTKQGICEVPTQYSYCQSPAKQNLVGYFLQGEKNIKVKACEICYQGTKQKQWEINFQRRLIEAKWFYFYDEVRQKSEDQAQTMDYSRRKNCSCWMARTFLNGVWDTEFYNCDKCSECAKEQTEKCLQILWNE